MKNHGLSVIEIILSLAILSALSAVIIPFYLTTLKITNKNQEIINTLSLAQEYSEAIKSIKNESWNNLKYNQSQLEFTNNRWQLKGESTKETLPNNGFRFLTLEPVYRTNSQEITDSTTPGAIFDPDTKKVIVNVTWTNFQNRNLDLSWPIFLTNYEKTNWQQTSWSQGYGQYQWLINDWVTQRRYWYNNQPLHIENETQGGDVSLGSGVTTGELVSSIYNTQRLTAFAYLRWQAETSHCLPDCAVKVQIRTGKTISELEANLWAGPDGKDNDETDFFTNSQGELIHTDHNQDNYLQYKVTLSGLAGNSPILTGIEIIYK